MHAHEHMHAEREGHPLVGLTRRDDEWTDNVKAFIHRPVGDVTSGGSSNGAGVQQPAAQPDTNDNGVATVVLMSIVTMDPTFSGSIAGYSTNLPSSSSVSSATSGSAQALTSSAAAVTTSSILSSQTSAAASSLTSATTTPAPVVGTPQAQSRGSSAPAATAASDASPTPDASAQPSSGMSTGAAAGLAIGIILALALIGALAFFCIKRKKNDTNQEETNEKKGFDEKRSSFFGASAAPKRNSADSDKSFGTTHTTATAPRLSLRPVTQFMPGFGGERRKSGNLLGANGPAMAEKPSAWERRGPSAENPFTDGASVSEKQSNPFADSNANNNPPRSMHSQKSSWETVEPATPNSATFAAAGAANMNGPAPPRGPNNVHRVQLDFKPSMDDELELKSGQLVRMLHEYDDGWALCIRMDRSQQGVAPRTCLSKMAVKPRGPPPGGRISPNGSMQGPPGPNSPRPMTPNSMNGPNSPRPMTPNGGAPRPMTPTGQGQVARKPVPGQAI